MRFLLMILSSVVLLACQSVPTAPPYYLTSEPTLLNTVFAQRPINQQQDAPLVSINPATNKLHYGLYANVQDHRVMNIIPDFSFAGYGAGGVTLPQVKQIPVFMTLTPVAGDNYPQIQNAINALSNVALNQDGLRGAILLKKGGYNINQPLLIKHSGIVLRGEGQGIDGTVLLATNTALKNTFITAQGSGNKTPRYANTAALASITQQMVPTGSTSIEVMSSQGYRVGDEIAIKRTSNALWLSDEGIDTQQYKWRAKSYALTFERTITAIVGNTLYIDIPLVDTIEARFSGDKVYRMDTAQRIHHVGIENLRLQTLTRDNVDDENRSFYANQEKRYFMRQPVSLSHINSTNSHAVYTCNNCRID